MKKILLLVLAVVIIWLVLRKKQNNSGSSTVSDDLQPDITDVKEGLLKVDFPWPNNPDAKIAKGTRLRIKGSDPNNSANWLTETMNFGGAYIAPRQFSIPKAYIQPVAPYVLPEGWQIAPFKTRVKTKSSFQHE